MKRTHIIRLTICAVAICLAIPAVAQNNASNKAFFAKDDDGVVLGAFDQTCIGAYTSHGSLCSAPITVFDVDDALKTSTNGAIEAAVSMECALMTYNTVTTESNKGKKTVSARAGVQILVEIDGMPAQPSPVIFCDRLQAVGLDIQSTCSCTVPGTTCSCTATDTITLELFESTKSAHSFHFFDGPLGAWLHDVKVTAQGIVVCTQDGTVVNCPNGAINEFAGAGTTAAIGKASLVLEEHNNWGSQ